jgi:hypothetical protein
MDTASFIASLAPELRQEILMQATDEELAHFPPNLVAEAQVRRLDFSLASPHRPQAPDSFAMTQVLRERAALQRDREYGMYVQFGDRRGGPGMGMPVRLGGAGAAPPKPKAPTPLKPGTIRLEKDRMTDLKFSRHALQVRKGLAGAATALIIRS